MPCSRSAFRPSVTKRRIELAAGGAVRFRFRFQLRQLIFVEHLAESYSSRPMSVLLPSSTLPQVINRSSSLRSCCAR